MDYNCQLIHKGMTHEENRIEVERGVGWISMKCTLPAYHFNSNTDFRAYGKIDLDMEKTKEGSIFKKMKMYEIFMLQGVSLKGN